MRPQSVLPGLLTPGKGWSGRVFESGLKGLYQAMRGMGMEPGQEMLAAMEEADACGAAIVYGDQEQSITLSRISQNISMGVRSNKPPITLSRQLQNISLELNKWE